MTARPAYRWVVVAAGAAILALSMGAMVNGLSAFILPLEAERGWDRASISVINSVGIIGMALGGLAAGRLTDRIGARPVIVGGLVVLGLAYLAAARAGTLAELYAIFALAGLLGAGAVSVSVMTLVGNWFAKGAGLAIGIAAAGQAAGQGGVPFASAIAIERWGTGAAFAGTGVAILAILVPLSMLLAPPPESPAADRPEKSGGWLPTRVVVWHLAPAVVLCCTCMSTPLMHLVPLIQDRTGVPTSDASAVLFAMLMIAILGRVAFGRLADLIGALPAYMSATLWMTLLVYGFMLMGTLGEYRLYALIYGFGYAGVMTGILVSVRVLVRPAHRGTAFGIVTAFAWLGHAIGGFQGGAFFEMTGSYHIPYAVAAISGLLNLAIVFSLFRLTRGPGRAVPEPL